MGWMSLPARKQIPGQAGDDGKNFSYSESKEGLKKADDDSHRHRLY